MKASELQALAQGFAIAIRRFVSAQTASLDGRLTTLEQRFAEANLKFVGAWTSERSYGVGDVTVHRGSLWRARTASTNTPPPAGSWELVVRKGRDGKDATRDHD